RLTGCDISAGLCDLSTDLSAPFYWRQHRLTGKVGFLIHWVRSRTSLRSSRIILRFGLCHGSMLAMGPMASDCHASANKRAQLIDVMPSCFSIGDHHAKS